MYTPQLMISLAHNSAGSLNSDIGTMRDKFEKRKRINLVATGFVGDIRNAIRKVLPTADIQWMALSNLETDTWDVECVDIPEGTPRKSKRRDYGELVDDILHGFAKNGIPKDSSTNFTPETWARIKQAYAGAFRVMSISDACKSKMTGLLAEHIAAESTKKMILANALPLRVVTAKHPCAHIPEVQFGHGMLPDQVTMMEPIGEQSFMEFDLLCRAADDSRYVAFDFSAGKNIKKHQKDRSERVDYVSREILRKPVLLIDAMLSSKRLSFAKKEDNLYRMRVPCEVDFSAVLNRMLQG